MENSAGTHRDVSQCFPSSDLASLDKVHRWRPCPPACLKGRSHPLEQGLTHTHTHRTAPIHGQFGGYRPGYRRGGIERNARVQRRNGVITRKDKVCNTHDSPWQSCENDDDVDVRMRMNELRPTRALVRPTTRVQPC